MLRSCVAAIFFIAVVGCAPLERKEIMATCQVLDTATTLRAVHLGAVEQNGLMVWLVAHPIIFISAKLALTIWIWHEWDKSDAATHIIINTVSCYPVPGNLKVIQEQKRINEG